MAGCKKISRSAMQKHGSAKAGTTVLLVSHLEHFSSSSLFNEQ
jgi:hypothetical protein